MDIKINFSSYLRPNQSIDFFFVGRLKKVLVGGFFSCLVAALVNPNSIKASPLSSYPASLFLLSPPDYFPDKAPRIAACMNFGETTYGHITLGIRTGLCALFDPIPAIGYGIGADIRLSLNKHWELEGYTDYFQTNILNMGYRHEIDFGVNALYIWIARPFIPKRFTPFLLGGISYANNDIRSAAYYTGYYQNWSPWLNLGLGAHYYFTKRFDITWELYYSLPLAIHPASYLTDIVNKKNYDRQILAVRDDGALHPGGIFFILSFNYTFGAI